MSKEYKIFAKTIEDSAVEQVELLANSIVGEDSNIRIMPDAHSGSGCVIGTTMLITDKICPNLIGKDIGCGVCLSSINITEPLKDFDIRIKETIPSGINIHNNITTIPNLFYNQGKELIKNLRCFYKLSTQTIERAYKSLGTLGGGNHFIEVYDNTDYANEEYKDYFISIHTGSRNIGSEVAKYYQNLADTTNFQPKQLSYLTGVNMEDYIYDMKLLVKWSTLNRLAILNIIQEGITPTIHQQSIHNYIDDNNILRKGAVSANNNEFILIPLNMRDGLLLCLGKGNEDWNYSAPHGAGRLYSRTAAKNSIKLEDYIDTMNGIYSTSVNDSTIDEAPFAYKNMDEIINSIKDTAEIIQRLIPIYNFKA